MKSVTTAVTAPEAPSAKKEKVPGRLRAVGETGGQQLPAQPRLGERADAARQAIHQPILIRPRRRGDDEIGQKHGDIDHNQDDNGRLRGAHAIPRRVFIAEIIAVVDAHGELSIIY
jgi:hypothetical protein